MLAGCAGALLPAEAALGVTQINSVIHGVTVGAQSYSFRDRSLAECIADMQKIGMGECELSEVHIEVPSPHDPDMFKARLDLPASFYAELRKKFDDAGIVLLRQRRQHQWEIHRRHDRKGFHHDPRHGTYPDHDVDQNQFGSPHRPFCQEVQDDRRLPQSRPQRESPDDFATAESIERALKGASEYAWINLDIGNFTAANQEAVLAFLREASREKIVTLHLKDRKRDHGPNVPFWHGRHADRRRPSAAS